MELSGVRQVAVLDLKHFEVAFLMPSEMESKFTSPEYIAYLEQICDTLEENGYFAPLSNSDWISRIQRQLAAHKAIVDNRPEGISDDDWIYVAGSHIDAIGNLQTAATDVTYFMGAYRLYKDKEGTPVRDRCQAMVDLVSELESHKRRYLSGELKYVDFEAPKKGVANA